MRTYVISCLVSCVGCDFGNSTIQYSKCYNLDEPLAIVTSDLKVPQLVADITPKAFEYYLKSLGGRIGNATTNPQIKVFNADEDRCVSELGFIQNDQPTNIYICKSSYSRIDWFTYMIAHEFGHVLGAGHADCADHTIMSPNFICVPENGLDYYPKDISAICDSGRVTGGVCGTRTCEKVH